MESRSPVISQRDATSFLDQVQRIMLVDVSDPDAQELGMTLWRGKATQYERSMHSRLEWTPIGSIDTVVAGLGKEDEEPKVHLMKVWVDRPGGRVCVEFYGLANEIDDKIPLGGAKSALRNVEEYSRMLPHIFTPAA